MDIALIGQEDWCSILHQDSNFPQIRQKRPQNRLRLLKLALSVNRLNRECFGLLDPIGLIRLDPECWS